MVSNAVITGGATSVRPAPALPDSSTPAVNLLPARARAAAELLASGTPSRRDLVRRAGGERSAPVSPERPAEAAPR